MRLQSAEERRDGNDGDVTAIERQELLRAEEEVRRLRREEQAALAADEEAALELEKRMEAEAKEEAGAGPAAQAAMNGNGGSSDAMEVVDPPE